jgi:hypothetical protein
MNAYEDAWLARRIAKRLSRHHLSTESSVRLLYSASDVSVSCLPPRLSQAIADGSMGVPVLGVISDLSDSDESSVLTTQAIVYLRNGELLSVPLDKLHHCTAQTIRSLPKGEHEYLALSTSEGDVANLWVRRGADFYAFWNIITDIIRLRQRL